MAGKRSTRGWQTEERFTNNCRKLPEKLSSPKAARGIPAHQPRCRGQLKGALQEKHPLIFPAGSKLGSLGPAQPACLSCTFTDHGGDKKAMFLFLNETKQCCRFSQNVTHHSCSNASKCFSLGPFDTHSTRKKILFNPKIILIFLPQLRLNFFDHSQF